MREQSEAVARPARSSRLRAVATVVVLAVTTWYATHLTSWDELRGVLGDVSSRDTALVAGLAIVNLATYWVVLAVAVPGLSVRRAAAVQLPATGLSNAAPAGGALGTAFVFVKLRSWGHTTRAVAAAMLVNGVLNLAAKLAAAVIAIVVATPTLESGAAPIVAGIALVASVVGIMVLASSPRGAAALGRAVEVVGSRVTRFAGRGPVTGIASRASRVQADIGDLVRDRRVALVVATVVSHVTLFLVFLTSVRVVGLDARAVGTAELLGAFAIARLVTIVPLTPGGVGLVELSLGASLAASGGDPDLVVAGVAVYRLATYVLPSLLGLGALAAWTVRDRFRFGRAPLGATERDGDATARPLVVDLDGTLLPVTTRTLMVARLAWRDRGALREYRRRRRHDRLGSKWFLWEHAGIDPTAVPVRARLRDRLGRERARGRAVYLASGAPRPLVRTLVELHDAFVDGWGSTADEELVGERKAALLVERFGAGGFDYVGDSWEDLPVWARAHTAIAYWPSRRLARAARRSVPTITVVRRPPGAAVALAGAYLAALVRQHPFRRGRPVARGAPGPAERSSDRLVDAGGVSSRSR